MQSLYVFDYSEWRKVYNFCFLNKNRSYQNNDLCQQQTCSRAPQKENKQVSETQRALLRYKPTKFVNDWLALSLKNEGGSNIHPPLIVAIFINSLPNS